MKTQTFPIPISWSIIILLDFIYFIYLYTATPEEPPECLQNLPCEICIKFLNAEITMYLKTRCAEPLPTEMHSFCKRGVVVHFHSLPLIYSIPFLCQFGSNRKDHSWCDKRGPKGFILGSISS